MAEHLHYPIDNVTTREKDRSLGLWRLTTASKLVLFIHGFGGDRYKTWKEFPYFLINGPKGTEIDVLSYQYDGISRQANNSATALADFLDSFLSHPDKVINASLGRDMRQPFKYSRVVLVAHSLGGVITRLALLRSIRRRRRGNINGDWLDKVRMVLFAPAHRGAYTAAIATHLLSITGNPIFTAVASLVRHKHPLLFDLQPDSDLIRQLKLESEEQLQMLGTHEQNSVVAERVVWAHDEEVVQNQLFCSDPDADELFTDHMGVCKPQTPADESVSWVEAALA